MARRRVPRVGHGAAGGSALVLALVVFTHAAPGAGSVPAPVAPLVSGRCQPQPAPGRVLCEVEAELPADAQGSLPWADLVVRAAPSWARPLRARLGPGDASSRTQRRVRFPLSLVATESGRGELSLSIRAVTCDAQAESACVSHQLALELEVAVGTQAPAEG